MQTFLTVILAIIAAGALGAVFFLYRKMNRPKEGESQSLVMLQNQIQELTRALDQKLTDTHKAMNETERNLNKTIQQQFGQNTRIIQNITGQSNKMISEITEKLTNLDKTNKQVIGFSEQLNNLEKVLTNQKKRGNLGEAGLQLVLENILPPTAFETQYAFKDGDTVDAIIKTKDGLIPVDAKFSPR